MKEIKLTNEKINVEVELDLDNMTGITGGSVDSIAMPMYGIKPIKPIITKYGIKPITKYGIRALYAISPIE